MKKKPTTLRTTKAFIDAGLIPAQHQKTIEAVEQQFALAITPAMQEKIHAQDDPIAKQFVPSEAELTVTADELADPIGDVTHSPVKGIVHRYPDRCLLKPVSVCPVYCRFCFRREKVGPGNNALTPDELDVALDYIASNKQLWEVIVTGGDPLIMKPASLARLLQRLDEISHVGVVRLHTRVPMVAPDRVTDAMVAALKLTHKPTYVVVHVNHANEFSPEAIQACANLVDNGIPLLSQTVLLKGVNDHPDAMSALLRLCVSHRIKPYYLHHGDLAKGTGHFRTSIEEGQALMQSLRGDVSGICQPTYILDIPGGYGKVPIGPAYVGEKREPVDGRQAYHVTDCAGDCHLYVEDV